MNGNQCGAVGVPGVLPGIFFAEKLKKTLKMFCILNKVLYLQRHKTIER